jgi:uncharacterized protein (TIRG00374 family)
MCSSNTYLRIIKKVIKFTILLLISGGCLFYVFRNIQAKELYQALLRINSYYFTIATLIYIAGYLLRALRWRYIIAPIKQFSILFLFRILTLGFAANNVLPLRGGELVRSYKLGEEGGISITASLATVALERILDGCTFVIFLFLVFFYTHP